MSNPTAYSAPGTIKARNKDNGVIYYVRPHMLEMQDHPWEVLPPDDGGDTVEVAKEKAVRATEVVEHTTAAGAAFKTEQAARTAMSKKELNEMEWAILPVEDGFIIRKV